MTWRPPFLQSGPALSQVKASDWLTLIGQPLISGWGSIDPEGTVWGPVLKQDYAQLYSQEECSGLMGDPTWVTDNMICAGKKSV